MLHLPITLSIRVTITKSCNEIKDEMNNLPVIEYYLNSCFLLTETVTEKDDKQNVNKSKHRKSQI
jgi:hypothetical protein